MRDNSMVATLAGFSFLCTLTQVLPASAEPDATTVVKVSTADGPATDQTSLQKPAVTELKPVEKAVSKPKPTVTSIACAQPKPPVYVADWARLAELTRSDSLIFTQVDAHASRRETARHVATVGAALGVAVALLGAFRGLFDDGWTHANKGTVVVGSGLTAVSLLTAWTINPDRDDFLTLINHWNLRHPDLVIAP
jgi:hypothetical protein